MKDNVIPFPERDRYEACLKTVIEGIKEEMKTDEPYLQTILIDHIIEMYQDQYVNSQGADVLALSINQKMNELCLLIAHYFYSYSQLND